MALKRALVVKDNKVENIIVIDDQFPPKMEGCEVVQVPDDSTINIGDTYEAPKPKRSRKARK